MANSMGVVGVQKQLPHFIVYSDHMAKGLGVLGQMQLSTVNRVASKLVAVGVSILIRVPVRFRV